MAQFIGKVQGGRGEATRLGTKKSGLVATVNGWDDGIRVVARINEETKKNEFVIYQTGGSNQSKAEKHLITIHT